MYFRKVTAAILTIIVFVCHIIPGDKITLFQWSSLLEIDKIFHFLLFGILSISYLLYFHAFLLKKNHILYTICTVFFYGLFLELLQEIIFVYRNFDILDLFADMAVSIFFIFCFVKLKLNKYFNLD